MRVLLVGATGFVGRHIGKALVRAGHEVIGCARNRHGAFRRYPDLGWMRADLATDVYRETWIPRLMGFDAVINAAGILRERAHDNFAAVHFAGPRALYEACAQAGVRRVIHVSALGCDRNPRPYAETKLRLDRHLATLDLDWVVLRPSLVYGEDSPSSRMFRALAALPAIPVVADGSQWLQPVHVDDLACIVARLLENDAIRRQVLDIGGPTPITYRDFLAGLRRSLYGRSSRFVGIPVAIARLGARLSDAVRAGPVGTDTLGMLLDGNVTAQNAAGTLLRHAPRSVPDFRPDPLVFLYDGACGICRAESGRLQRWSRGRDTLRFVDISARGFDPAPYGRTVEDLMGRVHAVRPDHGIVVGMDAIRAAYGAVGLGWLLSPTAWPGLRPLFDAAYLWFARNRYSLSRMICRHDDHCGA